MKVLREKTGPGATRRGEVKWAVLLWAIGVPLPLVLIVALMRGCS